MHIGQLIKSKMKEEGRKAKWLADRMHCDTSIIYRVYGQRFPETDWLLKICIHLKMNFFACYSEYVCRKI